MASSGGAATSGACPGSGDEGALSASASLIPARGDHVMGDVRFTQQGDFVHVRATVRNLSPGDHGFHVHSGRSCTEPSFASADGHFAPEGHDHGAPSSVDRHAGDFGNIVADSHGTAHVDFWSRAIRLRPGAEDSVDGRTVIVHAGRDDLRSQPSGDSGPKVACGVIELGRE